jgi:hypothetical protein
MQKLRNEESEHDVRGVEAICQKHNGTCLLGYIQLSIFRVIERSYILFRQFMLPYSVGSEQIVPFNTRNVQVVGMSY